MEGAGRGAPGLRPESGVGAVIPEASVVDLMAELGSFGFVLSVILALSFEIRIDTIGYWHFAVWVRLVEKAYWWLRASGVGKRRTGRMGLT
jgi:hypothetical protein